MLLFKGMEPLQIKMLHPAALLVLLPGPLYTGREQEGLLHSQTKHHPTAIMDRIHHLEFQQ